MRILVVEDERLLNNTLCYNLNMMGYTVDAALSKQVATVMMMAPCFIDFSEMAAAIFGEAITFTPLEYRLLKVLTKNPKVVVTGL